MPEMMIPAINPPYNPNTEKTKNNSYDLDKYSEKLTDTIG